MIINHFSRISFFTRIKMSLNKIIANNKEAFKLIDSIKSEISTLQTDMTNSKKAELIKQNAILRSQIEDAKAQLIDLEIKAGKVQIAINRSPSPPVNTLTSDSFKTIQTDVSTSNTTEVIAEKEQNKIAKEKKPKKEKPPGAETSAAKPSSESSIDVSRLDFRVGKIIEVSKHPDAESLYLEKIDCGEPNLRTVVSGLVKFVPLEEMRNRMVIVMCNLKPAKMRGITSEAMVMCASTPEKVEILSPPTGSNPGDLVHCEGYERKPDSQLNPKKKIFETCAPDLMTNSELVACFKGAALHVPGKGNVFAQTLKNVHVK